MYLWEAFPTACYRNTTWLQNQMAWHAIQAGFSKVRRFSVATLSEQNEENTLENHDLAVATVFVSISSIASILNKPGRTLSGSFNDPLAFIFFCGLFSIIKDDSLYRWSIKWSSFLLMYFHPYQPSFCFDFCITIATKDVFLFQVSTLRTNIYVALYFYKLIGISSPAAVHFNGAPFLWRRHPQDAL